MLIALNSSSVPRKLTFLNSGQSLIAVFAIEVMFLPKVSSVKAWHPVNAYPCIAVAPAGIDIFSSLGL